MHRALLFQKGKRARQAWALLAGAHIAAHTALRNPPGLLCCCWTTLCCCSAWHRNCEGNGALGKRLERLAPPFGPNETQPPALGAAVIPCFPRLLAAGVAKGRPVCLKAASAEEAAPLRAAGRAPHTRAHERAREREREKSAARGLVSALARRGGVTLSSSCLLCDTDRKT